MSLRNSRVYTAPVPKMPPGLVELMEGLARDVLKNSPTDVYAFCAEHMQKLLQIRNGSTTKKLPTLEEKIAIATKKVQERAAQRRKEFDKNLHLKSAVKKSDKIEKAEQYNQENIVKISENILLENKEHEIVVGVLKPKPETAISESKADIIDIPNSEQIQKHHLSPRNDEDVENDTIEIGDSKNIEENKTADGENIITNDGIITSDIIISNEEKLLTPIISSDKDIYEEAIILEKDHVSEKVVTDNIATDYKLEENVAKDDIISDENDKNSNIEQENVECCEILANSSTDINHTNVADVEEQNIEVNKTDEAEKVELKIEDGQKMNIESRSHVNNNSMDLETAAITIQKVFRSFLFRNKTCSIDDATNIDMNLLIDEKENKENEGIINNNINKDRRGISRMDTVLQTVNEEKSLSLSTDDSSTLSSAATIIQAHVRGFLVRNKLNVNKTISSTSGIDSDGQSMTSLEGDNDYRKSKTVLNIHIVPEGGHFMSRDESILTSTDLSLDGSPPGSTNLHPLGYDINVRRKQLKREDAIQSVSPPSNNSGKLSEDVDSVKEMPLNGDNESKTYENHTIKESTKINALNDDNIATMINDTVENHVQKMDAENLLTKPKDMSCLKNMASDEMDVVTPFETPEGSLSGDSYVKLLHSGECHDMVLPTKVSRSDTSIVRGE